MREQANKIPALITTDKRGVFFGYIDSNDAKQSSLEASEVQMCVYWSTGVKGVLGLASNGPDKSSKVTAAIKKAVLHGVTMVVECSDRAVEAWKSEPWA